MKTKHAIIIIAASVIVGLAASCVLRTGSPGRVVNNNATPPVSHWGSADPATP